MDLYRCDMSAHEGGHVSVSLHGYTVSKKTACGYWVDIYGQKKWVCASAKKRFAYPTKAEAIASFRARKRRQIAILTAQIRDAEAALAVGDAAYLDCTVPFTNPLDQPVLP